MSSDDVSGVRNQVEELDADTHTETVIRGLEEELVKEEETFMAAIGIKKLALPKPRIPPRPPKPRPPQAYEIGQSVVANWNGQLTLATVRADTLLVSHPIFVSIPPNSKRWLGCRYCKRNST
jgi:hypothetical protein